MTIPPTCPPREKLASDWLTGLNTSHLKLKFDILSQNEAEDGREIIFKNSLGSKNFEAKISLSPLSAIEQLSRRKGVLRAERIQSIRDIRSGNIGAPYAVICEPSNKSSYNLEEGQAMFEYMVNWIVKHAQKYKYPTVQVLVEKIKNENMHAYELLKSKGFNELELNSRRDAIDEELIRPYGDDTHVKVMMELNTKPQES